MSDLFKQTALEKLIIEVDDLRRRVRAIESQSHVNAISCELSLEVIQNRGDWDGSIVLVRNGVRQRTIAAADEPLLSELRGLILERWSIVDIADMFGIAR